MLSLLSRWLKPGRISIVYMAVMLVTTGCSGGSASSASHASQTRTGSRQILATFSAFFIPTLHTEPAGITQGCGETLWFTEESGNKIERISVEGGNVAIIAFLIPRADSLPTRYSIFWPHPSLEALALDRVSSHTLRKSGRM